MNADRREFAEAAVRSMALQVATGTRSPDCPDLKHWRQILAEYATNTERGPQ